MKRRAFLSGLFAGMVISGQALAQDIVASIIAQLRSQGFEAISQETTLLGRVRIFAERADGTREIILNPQTGEILRDLWSPTSGGTALVQIIDEVKVPPEDTATGTVDDGEDDGEDDAGEDDSDEDDDGDDDDGDDDGGDDDSDDDDDDSDDDSDSDDDDSDDDDGP